MKLMQEENAKEDHKEDASITLAGLQPMAMVSNHLSMRSQNFWFADYAGKHRRLGWKDLMGCS
jgi:hypothetical protein